MNEFLETLGEHTYSDLFNRCSSSVGLIFVVTTHATMQPSRLGRVGLLSRSVQLPLIRQQAYPDVSAQGVNFRVFIGGKPYLISGTSASSPTFAGIVALLNDARLHAGLPPLGFLNPLLYRRSVEALNDVTVGNNPGCGTNGFNVRLFFLNPFLCIQFI